MKNQTGMGHLMLILCIVIIVFIVGTMVYMTQKVWQKETIETYETDMLLIQGKVKVLSQEATIQKNEELLKGKKIEENIEQEQIKILLENNVISKEEASFSKYYIVEKETLQEMGLHKIKLESGYYIVNYDTDEVIYSEGVKVGDKIYYKLSELKLQKEQGENEI